MQLAHTPRKPFLLGTYCTVGTRGVRLPGTPVREYVRRTLTIREGEMRSNKRFNHGARKELLLSRLRKPPSETESAVPPDLDHNNDKLIEDLTATGQMTGRLLLTLFTLGALTILIIQTKYITISVVATSHLGDQD